MRPREDASIAVTDLPEDVTATLCEPVSQRPWDGAQITLDVTEKAQSGLYTMILTAETGSEPLNLLVDVLIVEELCKILLPSASGE